jgi:hypothetical protein
MRDASRTKESLRRVHSATGGFWFLPAIRAYSAGVAADDDHEIVRASFREPIPWQTGIARAGRVVRSDFGRPPSAICSVELRSPRALSYGRFGAFNRSYVAALANAGIADADVTPTARTNVVPAGFGRDEPVLWAFSFTRQRTQALPEPSYVISGAAESTTLSAQTVHRATEHSVEARADKARFVIELLTGRLEALELMPARGHTVSVYADWLPPAAAVDLILALAGSSSSFVYCRSRPPVEAVEFEMDVRRPIAEITI